ncbi:hypothetical protein FSP39_000281 [Pinctada imbricata]|uniref:Uncharacterized protein n=1 Tax=Pinctada imbricata TaxID=66713 RepID=A0AA88YJV6_PINIB|nr:hypothetical protein FSP39_000281 [Pinctada imbricata]
MVNTLVPKFDFCFQIGLFILGSINNLPYVIVTSAASTIADSFNKRNDVGVVFGANVALSVIVKGIIINVMS